LNLLLDENLSPRLIKRLASLFSGLTHARDVGLKRASDQIIWGWAKQNSYTIVTTDSDFVALSVSRGWPPKVVHLEECDFPLRIIEELLRQNAVRISEFDKDSRTGVLAVRFAPELRFR
jgi:predicted nuclease of predicted toxin-antitoxin system